MDLYQIVLAKKIALLFFFLVFLVVFLRLVLTRRATYDQAARIPLDDDTVVTPRDISHG
ncbi:MAG: CcoQ/FixQ family Cbb3-type cytochrome c oxidase assembly chaperone [Acidobacteriota bacterium]|nr:CcoQ/FixQ family Cbb3-type cytochrome c oxidase assembly chaperone [Acidobacteriota bacterium]MDH3783741.1 CcoQ/FixQ family Cbb3-type cytochrome c oxidase assembly chaperone [Acidobacteriota bacterium]